MYVDPNFPSYAVPSFAGSMPNGTGHYDCGPFAGHQVFAAPPNTAGFPAGLAMMDGARMNAAGLAPFGTWSAQQMLQAADDQGPSRRESTRSAESEESISPTSGGTLIGSSMASAAGLLWDTIYKRGDDAISKLSTKVHGAVDQHLSNNTLSRLSDTVHHMVDGARKHANQSTPAQNTRVVVPHCCVSEHVHEDRSRRRVLVIAPGFALALDPRQGELVRQAGFQLHWSVDLPNPDQPGFNMDEYLPLLCDDIDSFKPDLVACASKGCHYMFALWQSGRWSGASLLINVHPHLQSLPKDMKVVLAQGSQDEVYMNSRADLEALLSTGSPNKCFLYYAGSSGKNAAGQFAREGDSHNMASLLTYDCLPRLMDAAMCESGPEMHMMWTWRRQLTQRRLAAEQWLSYCPEELQRLWASSGHKGMDKDNLFAVAMGSQEFQMVSDTFLASPSEPSAYVQSDSWSTVQVVRVDRIENGWQEDGSAKPYYNALRSSIEDQGVCFQPGVHTRWLFHGTDAIDSIINNPMAGFQPLVSGSRLGSVWGSGTYFARDAKYVLNGNFCKRTPEGTYQMLMCLVMTGFPCLGDPEQKGVLPIRQAPHRYNSSVDSLSNPEIFIVHHPSAAYPAYLITFA